MKKKNGCKLCGHVHQIGRDICRKYLSGGLQGQVLCACPNKVNRKGTVDLALERIKGLELQVGELKKAAEKLDRAPGWYLDAERCDRKVLEDFMERYCLWYNNVQVAAKRNDECQHEWKDARNEHVQSGEICLKCNSIRAGNATTDVKRVDDRSSTCVHCDIVVPMNVPCPKCGLGGEKRKDEKASVYGWSSDPQTDSELQAKYGDSVHRKKRVDVPEPLDRNRCYCCGTEHCKMCGQEPCKCEGRKS